MKATIYSIDGKKTGEASLPAQFSEPVRPDLIKRAVLAMQSHNYQPHGADPLAGTKQGGATPKQRRKYRTTYGHGISRIRRKHTWHRGSQFGWVGAFVASAVKGRQAYPPLAEEVIAERINTKERRKAIRSAIAATAVKDAVAKRGHKLGKIAALPIIFEDKIEGLKKAKDVRAALTSVGLEEELKRAAGRKIRPGKGKMRGRRYRTKVGPLLIVSKACDLVRAARNLAGVDVVDVRSLNAGLLAPGCKPGRLAVWTRASLEELEKKRLFE